MIGVAAISFFLLLMGGLFLGVGGFLFLRTRKLLRDGVRTRGTVTEMLEPADSGQHSPIVSFTPAGDAVTAAGRVVSFRVKLADGTLKLGDVVPVLHDPRNPHHAIIADSKHLWAGPIIMGAVGGTMCLSAVGAWVAWYVMEII